jgi:hypothetical protein
MTVRVGPRRVRLGESLPVVARRRTFEQEAS